MNSDFHIGRAFTCGVVLIGAILGIPAAVWGFAGLVQALIGLAASVVIVILTSIAYSWVHDDWRMW